MGTTVAQATRLWDGRWELEFPYSREFVELLKNTIPHPHRKWVPERKVWIVGPGYTETGIHLLRSAFPDAIITNPEHVSSPTQHRFRRSDPHHVLYLHPDAPRCVVDAAYRALAKERHPDRAPEDKRDEAHEEMVALTRAYETIRDRLSA